MTVYVDDWRQAATLGPVSGRWSHLLGDDEEELHRFAAALGLERRWFQLHRHPAGNHYDVPEPTRERAIALGAVPITWRQAGRMLRAARRSGPSSDLSGPRGEGAPNG